MICLEGTSILKTKILDRLSWLTFAEQKRKKNSPCNSSKEGIDQGLKLDQDYLSRESIFLQRG